MSEFCLVLEFLARLEAHRFARGDGKLRACSRIAADTRFSRLHCEDAETAKFNAVTLREGSLHFGEDSLDGHVCFGFRDSCLVDDFLNDV